jgi:hypothetical protein
VPDPIVPVLLIKLIKWSGNVEVVKELAYEIGGREE